MDYMIYWIYLQHAHVHFHRLQSSFPFFFFKSVIACVYRNYSHFILVTKSTMKRNYTQRHIRRLVRTATNADLKEILHLSYNRLDGNQSKDSLSMVGDELLTFPLIFIGMFFHLMTILLMLIMK